MTCPAVAAYGICLLVPRFHWGTYDEGARPLIRPGPFVASGDQAFLVSQKILSIWAM
jgi:hypothetical protein